jgi:hypothetical protein
MGSTTPTPDSAPMPESAGVLLDQLLGSLLVDFEFWFVRGLVLLEHCPTEVMGGPQRDKLAGRLQAARRELAAARALRGAAPTPMALDMEVMAPWHRLVLSVWSLSSQLRRAGVRLPELPAS